MREAVQYVHQGQNLGLSGSESLRQYRAGGGTIRTQDWFQLQRNAAVAEGYSEYIPRLRQEMTIPKAWGEVEDLGYAQKYIMKYELDVVDAFGKVHSGVKRYVESDESLTMSEWSNELALTLYEDKTIAGMSSYTVHDVSYTIRQSG